MKKYLKLLIGVVVIGCVSGILYWGNGYLKKSISVTKMDTAMGTVINQTIYLKRGQNQETGQGVAENIQRQILDLEENHLSRRLKSGEIYRINEFTEEEGKGKYILPSQELKNIIVTCQEISQKSKGAFDISLGSLVKLWNIDSLSGTQPDEAMLSIPGEEEIQEALEHIGWQQIILQDGRLEIPREMMLDLGAVGKGAALDLIYQGFLTDEKQRVKGAVISVGGSILTYGDKPDGTPWKVGIINPFKPTENMGYLSLEGQWCVSTSGDYERYIEINNKRYHHILDPSTGYPVDNGVHSVTILSQSGLLSDALSTACFILGVEEGTRLAEEFQAEVLFVEGDGKLSMTEGMEKLFTKIN